MGQTLCKAAEYTSVAESGEKKLALVKTNEDIINKIITFVESYPGDPGESKLSFSSALTWTSTLKPDDISSWPSGTSNDQTKDGDACGCIKPKDSGYEITVWNLEHCIMVLSAAGECKMNETRNCLEANIDPTAVILGDRFATVNAVADTDAYFRFKEEVRKDQEKEDAAEDAEIQDKLLKLNMLNHIRNLDMTMKDEALQLKQEDFKVSPQSVEDQYNVLVRCAGEDEENNALEYIGYVQPYVHRFQNGCRAPFWQQVHGHISYIEARPHDTEEALYIVACTSGFFCTGYDKEKNDLTFEAEGETYKRLSDLLMAKSPRFAELIGKQHIFARKEEKRGIMDTTRDDRDYEREKEGQQTNRSERALDKKGQKGHDRKRKEQKTKKLEPSLKWKVLGVEEEEQKKDEDKKKYKPKGKGSKKRDSQTMREKEREEAEQETFRESESESEEEEEAPDRRSDANTDLPSEYWQIQKLVKYLKGGNQTATIIALCAMRDFNLQQETCQLAIRDVGGLEVLINLLDTDEIKCKIGALKILKDISKNIQIRRAIADLGGLQTMVKILRDPNKELKCLSAETIANVARFRRARRTVRQHGGIKKLVALLDCVSLDKAQTIDQQKDIEVARCGALALWSCSKSTENKQAMRRAGAIPLLAKLLKSTHENMLIPVVGTLQECASEQSYRLAIRTEGMVEDLVNNLNSENTELQMHCASAIFKCAEEEKTRDLVRQYGGLDPLVALLEKNRENKELLAAATGAIWKCSISQANVIRFKELKAIEQLVGLLNDQPEEVLVNVVGALAELAQEKDNRLTIRKCGGIPPLVQLLTGTNQALLVNVTKAVGQCAEEPDNMIVIDKLDGVRLLWSLLKNQNTDVQASAAWAICPCIENAKDAGEMVRSFVGGLELIVGLLESDDIDVLASVCAAIANIASDEENLAVITDHGVVPKLATLTDTDDDRLRRHLAEAIARCCNWGNNRVAFGQECAVAPLVRYLKSKDTNVHRSTAKALHQLSKDPDNCITMHEAGVVKPLMEKVGSNDDVLQEAAAGCIANIRRLALANEKARTK